MSANSWHGPLSAPPGLRLPAACGRTFSPLGGRCAVVAGRLLGPGPGLFGGRAFLLDGVRTAGLFGPGGRRGGAVLRGRLGVLGGLALKAGQLLGVAPVDAQLDVGGGRPRIVASRSVTVLMSSGANFVASASRNCSASLLVRISSHAATLASRAAVRASPSSVRQAVRSAVTSLMSLSICFFVTPARRRSRGPASSWALGSHGGTGPSPPPGSSP